jgi:hypothetical protein
VSDDDTSCVSFIWQAEAIAYPANVDQVSMGQALSAGRHTDVIYPGAGGGISIIYPKLILAVLFQACV